MKILLQYCKILRIILYLSHKKLQIGCKNSPVDIGLTENKQRHFSVSSVELEFETHFNAGISFARTFTTINKF